MNLNDMYTEVLMEHNAHPCNKHPLEDPTLVNQGVNPSCGDEIQLSLKLKDGVIEDAAFSGIGCAISQSSADIMIDLIRGKTAEEALALCGLFTGMIRGEVPDEDRLEPLDEALAFRGVSHMPARVKCAVLGWHTLETMLKK